MTRPPDAACVRDVTGVDSGYRGKEAPRSVNYRGRDTEEVTSMPDKRNASTISPHAVTTWAIWRPTFQGATLGYLAIRGVVVLRHVTFAEACDRYSDIRIERMPSLG